MLDVICNRGNSLPTYEDNLLVSFQGSRFFIFEDGTERLSHTSVRNWRHSLRNSPAERSSHV